MKPVELIEAIAFGHQVYMRGDTRSSLWLVTPMQYIVELTPELVSEARGRGWIKRTDDGNYVLTKKGKKKLQKRWEET